MKKSKENKKNTEKKSKEKVIKTCLSVLPIRYYDEDIDCFALEDNSYLDICEIRAKDRANLQDDELKYDIYQFSKFLRIYAPDFKIMSMNFPVSTAAQRQALEDKIKNTHDATRKLWLEREISELEKLDANVHRKEFFLFFYGAGKDEILKNKFSLTSWAGDTRTALVAEMSKMKKIQILRKVCNMNTLIIPFTREEDDDEEE